jgi:hypothetical protein
VVTNLLGGEHGEAAVSGQPGVLSASFPEFLPGSEFLSIIDLGHGAGNLNN